jgi:radical SAM PhpK family P-methyltransferase
MKCERLVDSIDRKIVKSQDPRYFNLNYLNYRDKPYYASDVLNLFSGQELDGGDDYFDYWRGVLNNSIGYLGSFLHRRGYKFDYINSFQHQKEELAEKLAHDDILLIGITSTYYVHYLALLEIVKFVRKHKPDAKIVVGGPLISNQIGGLETDEQIDAFFGVIGADIYVNNLQGETALLHIMDAVKHNKSLAGIDNIYYKSGQHYVANTMSREDNKLAENIVDWSLFKEAKPEYINVRTSVSCPFNCSFCGFPHRAGDYQRLSPEKIIEELDTLNTIETIETVNFIDDTFNLPPKSFKKLLKMMIERKYRFNWVSFLRCDYIDEETAELMKESGCLGVFLGIESANNQILINMNKGATVETYYEKIAILKKQDLWVYGSFIIGFPGETEETIKETRHFIENSGIDFFSGKIWFLEPVSLIMQQKEKFGIKGLMYEWSHNTMNSDQAIEINEDITFNTKNAMYVPDYQFSFWWMLHMFNKGVRENTMKSFLRTFNRGLEDKWRANDPKSNMSREVEDELRRCSIAAYREIKQHREYKAGGIEQTQGSVMPQHIEKNLITADFDL